MKKIPPRPAGTPRLRGIKEYPTPPYGHHSAEGKKSIPPRPAGIPQMRGKGEVTLPQTRKYQCRNE